MQGVVLSTSGIESHHSLGSGQKFHRHLRLVFHCIHSDPPYISKGHAFRLDIKDINDTEGPQGLVPASLVFGSIPAFPVAPKEKENQAQLFKALATGRNEMVTIVALSLIHI